MSRLAQNLLDHRKAGTGCLMPYITAGLPGIATTAALIRRIGQIGCPALELGFPFSDSIADGPVIQTSFYRALAGGVTVDGIIDTVASVRSDVSMGIVAMVSMSIVERRGGVAFLQSLKTAGFDGIIIPDLPVEESGPLRAAADAIDLDLVTMVAPTSVPARRKIAANVARGFIYLVAARGITGERVDIGNELAAMIESLRPMTDKPLIAGFGISTPEQVASVCATADGAIVGSAIVRCLQDGIDRGLVGDELVDHVGLLVEALQAAAT